MKYQYETPDGTRHHLELLPQPDGSYQAIVGERSYQLQVERYADGQLYLILNGRRIVLPAAAQNSYRYLAYQGQVYQLEKSTRSAARGAAHSHSGDLSASMPGQVIAVQVVEGEHVEKGQTLLLLEAMKMEMRIKAPIAGVVKKLLCAPGDNVERGQRLIEVEAAPG